MKRYEALLKILELGSFTRAAAELGYSQSAMSKMITSLEEEYGVRMIRRSRYGIQLTAEGEALLPYIRNIVSQQVLLRTAANDLHDVISGEIRIGTFASISNDWLAPMIERFWQIYPQIRFDLIQGDYSDITETVRSGRLDIGFVNRNAAMGLITRYLKTDEFLLVLPEGHPLAEKESIELGDIAGEAFLMVRTGEKKAFSELTEAFEKAGVQPNVMLHASDDYTILSMVEKGCGVSILSEKIIRASGRRVVTRSLADPIKRDICIVTRGAETVPVAARRFIDFMAEHVDELP